MKFAVGFKGSNKPNDVKEAVALFKSINPSDNGFKGLPPQPALAQAEQGICTGKEDDFFVGVIGRFQGRWEGQVGQEYKLTKGTLFPKSKTMDQLLRLRQGEPDLKEVIKAGNASMHDKIMAAANQQQIAASKAAFLGMKPPAAKSSLDIDLTKWLEKLGAQRLPFKITGGVGAQVGAGPYGGGAGTMEITNTSSQEKRTYKMYSASGGLSVAPISLSYSGSDAPSGALTHLYRGPLNTDPKITLDSFVGPFAAAAGGATGLAYGVSVTMYFLGLGYFNTGMGIATSGVMAKWEMLQRACGIAVVWGGQLGTPDAGVQIQLGKLLSEWESGIVDKAYNKVMN